MGFIRVFWVCYVVLDFICGSFGFIDICNIIYGLDFVVLVSREIVVFFFDFSE